MPKLGLRRDQLAQISNDPDIIRQFEKLFKSVSDLSDQINITYRMINDESGGDQDPLGAGGADWELSDDTENETILGNGNEIIENSGIFSFQVKGFWEIKFFCVIQDSSSSYNYSRLELFGTIDNLNYSRLVMGTTTNSSAANKSGGSSGETMVKVDDLENQKIKLIQSTSSASAYAVGSGSYNITYIKFKLIKKIQ